MRLVIALVAVAGCGENRTPVPARSDDASFDCFPNLDGVLESDELPVVYDQSATYLVNRDVAVSLASSGGRWSFDSGAGDRLALGVRSIDETWYRDEFPGGEFVALIGDGSGENPVEAIYSKDDNGLYLHGLASSDSAPGQETLWSYRTPVPVLRLPLTVGARWTVRGDIEGGTIDGIPYAAVDTYDVEVVADGMMALPDVDFAPVIRVSTRVDTAPAVSGLTIVNRQDSYYFECFGELVRSISPVGESERNYPVAEVLLRIEL